jgi:hypothetical protein
MRALRATVESSPLTRYYGLRRAKATTARKQRAIQPAVDEP